MAHARSGFIVSLLAALFSAQAQAFDPESAADLELLEREWIRATGLESIDIRTIRRPNPFLEGLYPEIFGDAAKVLLHSTLRATVASGDIGADVRCELDEVDGAIRIRRCRDLVGGVGMSVMNGWSKTGTLDFELAVSERGVRPATELAPAPEPESALAASAR